MRVYYVFEPDCFHLKICKKKKKNINSVKMSEELPDYKTWICDVKCFFSLTLITELIFPVKFLQHRWALLSLICWMSIIIIIILSVCLRLCLSQGPLQTASVVSPEHSKTHYYQVFSFPYDQIVIFITIFINLFLMK